MNKYFILIILIILLGCKTISQKVPPPIKIINNPYYSDSFVYWKLDSYNDSNVDAIPLSEVKRDFKIENGKLFDIKNDEVVQIIHLVLITDTSKGEDVEIRNGLPYGSYCNFINGVTCREDIHYDETGNIDGYFSVENYNTKFRKGAGYWKDYYINKKNILKEEGEVKNNFKFGEWRYYNKNGEVDSIKTYILKDSVDVRFPHCIFNKNEPCY